LIVNQHRDHAVGLDRVVDLYAQPERRPRGHGGDLSAAWSAPYRNPA
jgi:hypothetical protein